MNDLYGVLYEDNYKNNKLELLEYANDKNLGSISFIDQKEFYNSILDNKIEYKSRYILKNLLDLGDTLVDILKQIDAVLLNRVTLYIIENDLEISTLTCNTLKFTKALILTEELVHEKRLQKRRAKNLKDGVKVGRKSGVLIRSKFDSHREKIEELYTLGLSMKKIVDHIGVGTQQSLHHYIKTRGIVKS